MFHHRVFFGTFACHGALRLCSDEERVLTPLPLRGLRSEEYFRPERSRVLCGVVEGQVQAKVLFLKVFSVFSVFKAFSCQDHPG